MKLIEKIASRIRTKKKFKDLGKVRVSKLRRKPLHGSNSNEKGSPGYERWLARWYKAWCNDRPIVNEEKETTTPNNISEVTELVILYAHPKHQKEIAEVQAECFGTNNPQLKSCQVCKCRAACEALRKTKEAA